MAKQTKQKQQKQPLSPENYIRSKARTLPVAECYMGANWQEVGESMVVVARQHNQGTYTVGIYLVDTFCKGLADGKFFFSINQWEYKDLLEHMGRGQELEKVSYEAAHNLIYGAIAYAEEAGIQPDKSFNITQYILEEDTDDVPLIEYDFGKNGRHYLIANNHLEASRYLPLLKEKLGDDYDYVILADEDEYSDDDWDEELDEGGVSSDGLVPYTYVHPEYPAVLSVKNQHLVPLFFDHANMFRLDDETIKAVLELPRETLINDLEQIILFSTGCICDEVSAEKWEEESSSEIMHALFFLTELRAEASLDVVLETLRQREDYYEFLFGDTMDEVYVATLYLLGRNQLDKLMAYAKEPGLHTFARCYLFPAIALIAVKEPERREEILEWFRQIILFYVEELPKGVCCDGDLVGMMVGDLMDIKAVELLPYIKNLYDTGCMAEDCCGNYEEVEKEMRSSEFIPTKEYPLDIYERYRLYDKNWNRGG